MYSLEFEDDPHAYYYGYTDSVNYEQLNGELYNFSSSGIEQYRAGYAKGMDANLYREQGIAPLENRSNEYQETYSYYL